MASPLLSPPETLPDRLPRLLDEGGIVVCSYCFPPMAVGSAFILDRVLSQFDLGETVVYAGRYHGFTTHLDDFGKTKAEVVFRDVPRWWPRRDRELRVGKLHVPVRIRTLGNLFVSLRVAFDLARELRKPERKALLVVYPTQPFLLAGCLAALTTKKPFLVYLTDVYVEGLPRGKRVGRLIERYMARRASALFGMSDAHCAQLAGRMRAQGVEDPLVVEIPQPYVPPSEGATLTRPLEGKPAILFTGAIYNQHVDSVQRLIEALDRPSLADLDPRFNIFSQFDAETLAQEGIEIGGRVSLRSATVDETLAGQRAADILFLAMSFTVSEAVRTTGSPTKTPEYLAAGRPILVHAPSESYVARYAREYGWGEVVSEPDVHAVAHAIRRLATDEARQAELVAAAAATLPRHLAPVVAETFRQTVRKVVADGAR
jgi:hypothetical protein